MGEITIAQDANEIGPQSLQKETGLAIFLVIFIVILT